MEASFKTDKYKDVIIESLKFPAKEKWVEVNVFCPDGYRDSHQLFYSHNLFYSIPIYPI
jgi:hypothetical protein